LNITFLQELPLRDRVGEYAACMQVEPRPHLRSIQRQLRNSHFILSTRSRGLVQAEILDVNEFTRVVASV